MCICMVCPHTSYAIPTANMPAGTERRKRKRMRDQGMYENQGLLKSMTYVGVGVTVLVVLMRLWLLPAAADWETGLFTSNYWVIALMLGALAALLVMNYFSGPIRREITGIPSAVMALGSLLMGAVMAVTGALDLLRLYEIIGGGTRPDIGPTLPTLEYAFCVLGGVALVRLGLALLSEGGTRRGIAQWSVLAPVLWAWFRLIGYEMSYASMVRIEDNFFGFVMLIVEMLFLFRLARYASGIGRVSAGSLMFHAMATTLFAVSGPLVRLGMYLLQDHVAYDAYQLAGPLDIAVGVFALVVGLSLLHGKESLPVMAPSSDADDVHAEDVASSSTAADLLLDVVEEE